MKKNRIPSLSIPLRGHSQRPSLFFGRGWLALCLLACGWIGQPHTRSHASTQIRVESSRSFWENFGQAREYKKRYHEALEDYEASRAAYEEAMRELVEIREEILLHNGNEEDFLELLRRERRAWGRLYRENDGEESRAKETGRLAPDLEPSPPGTGLENVDESRNGLISRTIHRYRFWKNKYDTIREMRDELEKHRAGLDPVLRERREELRRARERSGDSRNLLQRELDAWSRLYRNSPNATPE